jgi:tRNA(Ile)-lysidine synthetase-like protein
MQTRFNASLEFLLVLASVKDGPLGVCVSGGPDSLALLRLTRNASARRVVVLHVNHRLRPEADAEERWLFEKLPQDVECYSKQLEWTGQEKKSHEHFRQKRYAALGEMAREHGLQALLLAHHRDDLMESFVERVQMASGLAGLAVPIPKVSHCSSLSALFRPALQVAMADVHHSSGLPPHLVPALQFAFPQQSNSTHAVLGPLLQLSVPQLSQASGLPPLLRPALQFLKSELRSVLNSTDCVLHDPSNSNPKYLRSRVRQVLDDVPDAHSNVSKVADLVRREWEAVERTAVRQCQHMSVELLKDKGHIGVASRLVLSHLLQRGDRRRHSGLAEHAAEWMTRAATTARPVAVFSESGVRIVWRKKTGAFRSIIFGCISFFR